MGERRCGPRQTRWPPHTYKVAGCKGACGYLVKLDDHHAFLQLQHDRGNVLLSLARDGLPVDGLEPHALADLPCGFGVAVAFGHGNHGNKGVSDHGVYYFKDRDSRPCLLGLTMPW